MRGRAPSVLGIGDNTVDVYVDKGWMFPGGNAVNVAAMSGRLGAFAGYIGCLSSDRYGSLVYEALSQEKVDLSRCRRADGPNGCALIGHEDGDRRFLGSRPGVRANFSLVEDDFLYMASFDVVHTSVHSGLDHQVPMIGLRSKLLSYDFSNRWSGEQRDLLAPHVDIAFLSLGSAEFSDCEAILRQWSDVGCKLVIGTRGGEGSLALFDDRLYAAGVKSAQVVDTLGAGDGFIAGFLVEWKISSDVSRALEAGARNAAAICGVMGAFGHGVAFSTLPEDLPPRRPSARA
ncbi:MAG: sugar kinase [Hyphomicrobiaceae bacterium]|nr:sugar kinase [Hyphomicrobiaceae bacterium]